MKKLITLLALTITMTALAGFQQDATLNGGTNNVLANSTNTYRAGTIFDLSKTTAATFEFSFNCGAASTANYTITFDASADATTHWATNAFVWQVAGNGISTNGSLTNLLKSQMLPFYRVGQIWNTNASTPAISNCAVRVFTSTGR